MKYSRLPPETIDRLMAVNSHADRLARTAAIAESEVAGSRALQGGHTKADAASVLRARTEFPELLKRAQAARQRADAAMRTASSCKAWVDLLADDAVVELVEVKPNGADLGECRSRIAELRAEINRIRTLPPPSDRELIETFIDEIRRPAVSEVAQLIRRWPHFASSAHMAMGNDRSVIAALTTVMTSRAAQIDHLCAEIDAAADAAMPPGDRPAHIVELEAQLVQLQALEAMYVNGAVANGQTEIAHDPSTPPQVILGVRLVCQA